MGSRPLPLALVLAALLADAAGGHRIAFYLLLLAVPGAAAAAFVAVSDALERRSVWPRALSTAVALALVVTASAVRGNAPPGAHVPSFAISAAVTAVLVYGLAPLAWLLEPLRVRLRLRPERPVRVRPQTEP